MLSLIRWSEDCFTGWQSGVCIVGNRGKEGGRNLGWISQHVTDVERERDAIWDKIAYVYCKKEKFND